MRPFLIVIHDATPAFERETRLMLRDLAPRVGRRLAFGVVPDWHGRWPLAAHAAYCGLLRDSADELLLHGFHHRRRRGWGPISALAEGADEMNGLDRPGTERALERGQGVFHQVFGERARGFLAPAWQRGELDRVDAASAGLDHTVGFFALDSVAGRRVPLATWTWDCGRWRWLGHVGHAIGRVLQSLDHRVPALAVHPRDIGRGFWPAILRVADTLLDAGYEPTTPALLLDRRC